MNANPCWEEKMASFLFSGLARFTQEQNIWFLPFSRTASLKWNFWSLQLRFQEKSPDNAILCAVLFLVRFAKELYGTANQIKTKTVMRWNTHPHTPNPPITNQNASENQCLSAVSLRAAVNLQFPCVWHGITCWLYTTYWPLNKLLRLPHI